ncbi:hypothetical protein Tco_1108586 [Tanacetum coccineum]
MNQHRVILPIFSTPTRNNTRLLRTNRIRLPQVPKTQIRRNRIPLLERKCHPPIKLITHNWRIIKINNTASKVTRIQEIRNHNFFSQQPSQPQYFPQPSHLQYFPQPSSQPVPQAKEPREAKRKQKRAGKQPVVDLDEDDEDDENGSGGSGTAEYRKRPTRRHLLEPDFERFQLANNSSSSYQKYGDGKMDQDARRKCDAAEKAYEAKREKELAIMQCKELEFLMIDPSALPAAKRAIIERKQAEIMRKYPDA